MTSTERGQEMMLIPMRELPPQALEYARHLCQRIGQCGEVMLTAYCHYAEVVEELPCDDPAYLADEEARRFFS